MTRAATVSSRRRSVLNLAATSAVALGDFLVDPPQQPVAMTRPAVVPVAPDGGVAIRLRGGTMFLEAQSINAIAGTLNGPSNVGSNPLRKPPRPHLLVFRAVSVHSGSYPQELK